ncbi:hypothetical protein ACFT8W_25595 [Streptomyces hygroscopicus]|uniref:hypothetical protein n=1 Tax=Streptomyces hygroscopicus TaxID=1912 RepID=UPI0036279DA8
MENMTMDHVTSEYVRRCRADQRLRSVMATSLLPPSFQRAWKGRHLPRPIFADRQSMETLGTEIKILFDIVVSLPDRLFDGDLGKFCAAIGIDEPRAVLISRLRDAEPPRAGRADLYRDGADFKLLEFNVNTGFSGGADIVELCRALMAAEPFAEFATEFGLEYTDIMAIRAGQFRDAAARVSGGREPVIALIEADGALEGYGDGFRSMQSSVAGYGIELALGELGQLESKNGRVHLDGKPLDLVLRYYNLNQIIDDAQGQKAHEMICRAHERGQVVMHTPLQSDLFDDKAILALLSDSEYRQSFSEAEKQLIDRMLPWTRLVRDGWTRFNGERVDFMTFSVENQQNLILKPGAGLSGMGIVAGWETERDAWEKLLRRSAGGPYLLQQRVNPTPEPFVDPDSGLLEHVVSAWGVFFSEKGYNGGHVRTAPSGGDAVINFAGNPKSSITGLFTFDGRSR